MAVFAVCASGQRALSATDSAAIEDFGKRVSAYSKLRARVARKLRKLPPKATPEQIDAHKLAFQKGILASRRNARQGDMLTPGAATSIRKLVGTAYVGEDRTRLRDTILEAENKNVAVRVNAPYPPTNELLEMPPTLLLVLPQLPKELTWRFVANNLLLLDNDNLLILDFMTNALPAK